jgi:hypothetical protein
VRESALAAQLIECLLNDGHLAPIEIERLVDCYWRAGSFWGRFRGLASGKKPADAPISTAKKTSW